MWTNGSVSPADAVAFAAKIVKEQLSIFINFDEHEEPTVVAEAMTRMPAPFKRCIRDSSGRPKWKLATLGLNSSTRSQAAASKAARDGPLVPAATPSSS